MLILGYVRKGLGSVPAGVETPMQGLIIVNNHHPPYLKKGGEG